MESTIDNPIIVEITEQEAKRKGKVGKYLNKLVVPGCLYIVEQVGILSLQHRQTYAGVFFNGVWWTTSHGSSGK